MNPRCIVLLGATGFIGSGLVRFLSAFPEVGAALKNILD